MARVLVVLLCFVRLPASANADSGDGASLCRDVYEEHPLEFLPGEPDTCFGGRQLKWLVAAHHKTGTVFSKHLITAVRDYCGPVAEVLDVVPELPERYPCKAMAVRHEEGAYFCAHWAGDTACLASTPERRENLKVTHFVRDPLDMILSAYNFHREGLGWTNDVWPVEDRPRGWFDGPEDADITYTEALNRLPLEMGLLVEAERSKLTSVNQMASSFCASHADPNYLPTRFIDYIGEGADTNACKLFRFLGMREKHASALASEFTPPPPGEEGGMGKGSGSHVTAGTYNKTAQLEVLEGFASYPLFLEIRAALAASSSFGAAVAADKGRFHAVGEACTACSICTPTEENMSLRMSCEEEEEEDEEEEEERPVARVASFDTAWKGGKRRLRRRRPGQF